MSSGSPPSGGRIQALLTLLVAFLGPPAALLAFARSLNLLPWVTVALVLAYEVLAFCVSFLTEVWQKLKAPWVEAIANRIDRGARSVLSHYRRHYYRYFTYEHRNLDMKGVTPQGVYTLDLEEVFVELRLDPKASHAASADPLHGPIDLSQVPAELRSGSHTIWEYLAAPRLRDQHFVVLGPPGSGKTTLLKHLGLALVHRTRARAAKSFSRILPVLLVLREHSKAIVDKATYTLADAIHESTNRWDSPMPAGWIEHRLVRGQCLILLDGLDEVADAIQRQQTVSWVERQMKNHGQNRFVLTSRPFGYRENPLAGVTTLEVQPLTFQQATQFVVNWYRANEVKRAVRDDRGVRMKAEQDARDLLRRLRETPDLFALVVNPLLLTMIATVHCYRGTLPGARVDLYEEICKVFLGKRQEARGIAQDLRADQRQLMLQPLAYAMMVQGVRTIDGQQAESLIADSLQQVSMTLAPRGFLESVQNSSGLLLEREHGVYGFAHKTFQEYLAAVHISKQGLVLHLASRVCEEWWYETIRLYCAQADATPLVEACLNISSTETLILALECGREAQSLQVAVQRRVEAMIVQGIEGADPERRRITAEVLLARRLRQMRVLNERTFIDTALVTHAEYQLFLDELRTQCKYHQPDHWTDFTFSAGQGQQPALGMRRSDAQAFCVWLSQRAGGTWRYRLPDEKDIVQADRGLWKDISQDTCYWTEGEQRFVWPQGQPSPSLSTRFQEILTHDLADALVDAYNYTYVHSYADSLARTNSLDIDLDLDVARALAHALARTSDIVRTPDIARDLDRAYAETRDLDRIFADAHDLARTRAHNYTEVLAHAHARTCALARALTHAYSLRSTRDLALARTRALNLCIDLFLLQERRVRRLPAWEGILLVKERILDV